MKGEAASLWGTNRATMNTQTTPVSEKALRAALRSKFGTRKYRITSNRYAHGGLVEAIGVMPNTNIEGWYILGPAYSVEVLSVIGLGNPYA